MAKAIKRVGIMLLAVAIICLMAIGVILGVNGAKSETAGSLNLNNEIKNNLQIVADQSYTLSGTNAQMAATWNEAVTEAKNGKNVFVQLGQNWVGTNNTSGFGSGVGFYNGGLQVPSECYMTLDLNGKTLDRNLTSSSSIEYGMVINVRGSLSIFDSQYDSDLVENKFKSDPLHMDTLTIGKIKGGNITTYGGGILVESGQLNFYSGMVCNNKASSNGGAIAGLTAQKYIYGGVICNNTSNNCGGIGVFGKSTLHLYDGYVVNNSGSYSCGGISITGESSGYMYDGYVSYNLGPQNVGGINVYGKNCYFEMHGGEVSHNSTTATTGESPGLGGGISISQSGKMLLAGGKIVNNTAAKSGAGLWCANSSTLTMTGGYISNNNSNEIAGGMYVRGATFNLSGGSIYGNTSANGSSDLFLESNQKINITGLLFGESGSAKGTHIGIEMSNQSTTNIFTTGYMTYNNRKGVTPSNFFFSSVSGKKVALSGEEAQIVAGDEPTAKVTWQYGVMNYSGGSSAWRNATEKHVYVPYNREGYVVRANGKTLYNGISGISYSGDYYPSPIDPGTYTWYVNNYNFENPTFTLTILPIEIEIDWQNLNLTYSGESQKPIAKIVNRPNGKVEVVGEGVNAGQYLAYASVDQKYYKIKSNSSTAFVINKKIVSKPSVGNNVLLYKAVEQEYLPQNFNADEMSIKNNKETDVNNYNAEISLKDTENYVWENGSTGALTYAYSIIRDSVIGANSEYDYVYKDGENKRQNYTDNKIYHKYNDNTLNVVNGISRYVIGNINANTSVRDFIANLKSEEITKVKLFDSNGTLIYNGTTQSSSYDIDSTLVQTGWYLQYESYFANTETIYLSVLGDVIADGMINTIDVTFINRIVKGEIDFNNLTLEQQLAAMVDNKGKVTSTDGKILLNVIGGNTQTESYFENVAQEDKYQILVLNSTSGKTYRQNMNLTTLNVYDNAIIGNIAPQTKASDFKTKLATQTSANADDITIYKANGAIAGDNDYIGTGYYINYDGKTIYLSVLGDLTGDGEVNTMDVTCLNRIISGNVKLNTNDIKDKLIMLSAIIQNKGNLTTADSETLLNYIGGNADMTKYF